jgi:hypothetical protein
MAMTVDTSAEAVERLAVRLEYRAGTRLLDGVILPEAAATLRALAAERDAAHLAAAAQADSLGVQLRAAEAERDAARAEAARLRAALKRAEQFIVNGTELGFIRMPNPDTPDTAHETLPAIRAALARDKP